MFKYMHHRWQTDIGPTTYMTLVQCRDTNHSAIFKSTLQKHNFVSLAKIEPDFFFFNFFFVDIGSIVTMEIEYIENDPKETTFSYF